MTRHVKEFHFQSASVDVDNPTESDSTELHKHDDSQGKLLECPVKNCKRTFKSEGHMRWHVKEFHGEAACANVNHPNEHVCADPQCRKAFKYPSKLHKHEDSHGKLHFMCFYLVFFAVSSSLISGENLCVCS